MWGHHTHVHADGRIGQGKQEKTKTNESYWLRLEARLARFDFYCEPEKINPFLPFLPSGPRVGDAAFTGNIKEVTFERLI